jgi:hypothetical protein
MINNYLLSQITNVTSPINRFQQRDFLISDLLGRILLYAIPIAGLFFFVRLLAAGFGMMSSLGDPGKVQASHTEITNALLGLLIVLTAFFITQIVEVVFGINIL